MENKELILLGFMALLDYCLMSKTIDIIKEEKGSKK